MTAPSPVADPCADSCADTCPIDAPGARMSSAAAPHADRSLAPAAQLEPRPIIRPQRADAGRDARSPAAADRADPDGDPQAAFAALVLRPGDRADAVGCFEVRDRDGGRRRETVVVVLHRCGGLWTHVYRVVEPARGRRQVKLEKVFAGDRTAAARHWAATVLTRPLARALP